MLTFDYRGKVVIVTGVGRPGQIGNAVAMAFARAGAQMVLCDVNATGVAERAKEFQALGLDARPAAGDLTEPDVARHAVETAVRQYGRLDALVNIAGGLTTFGPIDGVTVKAFDREIGINLKTAVVMSQAAIDELAKSHGSIVNVASIASFQPQASMAVYAAAKAGVAAFTRSLAVELQPRFVRVNAIAPAMVRTPENLGSAGADATYVEMEHITQAVMFLASAAAEAINGLVLPISRGVV